LLAIGGFVTRILRAPLTARAPSQSQNCEAAGEFFGDVLKARAKLRQRYDGAATSKKEDWLAEP
jgi:hypothetical protein